MSIGRKILILQTILIFSFMACIFGITHWIWGENYLKLEQRQVKENVLRCSLAWSEEIHLLGSLVEDWAPWDELYSFVNHLDEPFAKHNLTDSAMANLQINVVIITDREGKVLYAKSIDLNEKIEVPVPQVVLTQASSLVSQRKQNSDDEEGISGFIITKEYPMFVAVQRILPSNKQGDSNGFLLFLKFADQAMIHKLTKKTQVEFTVLNENINQEILSYQFEYPQKIDDDKVEVYYPMYDIYGRDSIYLASRIPRDIFKEGQLQTQLFLLLTMIFGLLLLLLTLLLLHKIVLAPLSKIERFINEIIKDETTSIRLNLPGKDEFSKIAVIFNTMLNQIEIRELYKAAQQEIEGRKKNEEVLTHMSYHDALTGLYNRTYFKKKLEELSGSNHNGVGVICCDVDGLKIINDTMGHTMGDVMLTQVAKVLTEVFAQDGLVARIGGDEFTVIVTGGDENYIWNLCQNIPMELDKVQSDAVKINVSVGWSWCDGANMTLDKFHKLIRDADDLMYRNKLSSRNSNRNTLVQGMMEMLKARDFITEGHSQRIQDCVISIGKSLFLSDRQIADLCLLAQFHDIGKIGVSDAVLFKPGMLTGEERKEIERHSAVGYRIAQAIPELLPIADFILKHHEWWNGKGYPLGLQGTEIPIENRIIAIADAFDAMTNDRPYRPKMSISDALVELKKFAGSQFDPELVEKFAMMMNEEH